MRIVYIPGCWDLLHRGHMEVLKRAKSLGKILIVGVASDAVVFDDKGQYPIVDLADRVAMLQELRCVNFAAPYYDLEFLTHLQQFKPDILAVGETWGRDTRHQDAEHWCEKHDARLIKLPYTRSISSTSIKNRIKEQ